MSIRDKTDLSTPLGCTRIGRDGANNLTKTKITFKFFINLPKFFVLGLIKVYQFTLSPDHGWLRAKYPNGYCRHYPTCSEYSKQAIDRYGIIKGMWLSTKRVASCNPWVEPKIDLVPTSHL